jgi:hypothetical protein
MLYILNLLFMAHGAVSEKDPGFSLEFALYLFPIRLAAGLWVLATFRSVPTLFASQAPRLPAAHQRNIQMLYNWTRWLVLYGRLSDCIHIGGKRPQSFYRHVGIFALVITSFTAAVSNT